MFKFRIVDFIGKAVDALRDILLSEDVKPISVTLRIPTMYRAKYGMPKITQRNDGGMK